MAEMLKKTDTGTIKTAFNKAVNPALTYEYAWSEYPDGDTLIAAKDEMTIDEQVKSRNSDRMNNARQKAYAACLAAAGIVKPTAETDPQVGLREMFKTLQTAKLPNGERRYTDEQARELASANLGAEWAE